MTIVGADGMYYRQDASTCHYGCAIETTDGYHVCGDYDDCNHGMGVWGWIVLVLVFGIFGIIIAIAVFKCVKKGTKEVKEALNSSHSSSD